MLVKGLGWRVHSRAVTRWRKVQEGAELSQCVSWTRGLWTAKEAVSREVTGMLWDSHHTNGSQFSLWDFVPVHLKKGHLESVPLAGLGCRVCLLSLRDETACKHRGSCEKSLGSSLLPAAFAAYPDSLRSAQAVLVTPLHPKTALTVYVRCGVGESRVTTPSATAHSDPHPPGSYSGTNRSHYNSEITPSNWLWTELCSAVNGLFVARFGFVSSPVREKTVRFTWAQWKENWESQSLTGLVPFPDLSLIFPTDCFAE